MPRLTLVKLLYCGQGMTTLVEVYDEGNTTAAPDFLALVDCGGDSKEAVEAINYIAGKIKQRNPPKLDCLIISHQDADHVRLLADLQKKIPQNTTLDWVFIGGLYWAPARKKTVRRFLDYVNFDSAKVSFSAPFQSDYSNVAEWSKLGHFARYEDVHLRILVANLDAYHNPTNATSATVVIDNGKSAVILPGDATYETMSWICDIDDLSEKLLPGVRAMEVPHHGALATAVENYRSGGDPDDFDWSIIEEFAQIIAPRLLGASAGPWNTHKHPKDEVLAQFLSTVGEAPLHSYVSFVFETDVWRTWKSKEGIYCTIRIIGNLARSPQVRKTAKGTFAFGNVLFKMATTTAEAAVEFHPLGTFRLPSGGDGVVEAPEP